MAEVSERQTTPVIIGRSSSPFTRVARIFALEMRVDHDFQVVRDLLSRDARDYGGNPALRMPVLKTSRGVWFGALNICRELHRQSPAGASIVWPDDLEEPLPVNAQELVVQAMSTEVSLIMSRISGGDRNPHQEKMSESLINTLAWLETNAAKVLAALPADRDLSYLEVTLFCLVTHLRFRDVVPVDRYARLGRFCLDFALRGSAVQTAYRMDG